jgi:hypothetical protein
LVVEKYLLSAMLAVCPWGAVPRLDNCSISAVPPNRHGPTQTNLRLSYVMP